MKHTLIALSLFALLATWGCGNKDAAPEPASQANATATDPAGTAVVVGYELGSKKKGDKGVCVICNKVEGTTAEEEVVETLDYQGKTYIFCDEKEKAEFIADPKKYVGM